VLDPDAACDAHPFADRDELLNDFTTAAVDASAQPDRPHGPGGQDAAPVLPCGLEPQIVPPGMEAARDAAAATDAAQVREPATPDNSVGAGADAPRSIPSSEPVQSVGTAGMAEPAAGEAAANSTDAVPAGAVSLGGAPSESMETDPPAGPGDGADTSAMQDDAAGGGVSGSVGTGPGDVAAGGGGPAEADAGLVSAVAGLEDGAPAAETSEAPLFSDLGLSEPIVRAVEEMGYRHPTPIQAQAIPVVLAGRDVLGVAQTGTGKTAGFTLPMLDILAGRRSRARMPRSLILEPTRELALQVAENFVKYGKYLKLNHALLIGGESLNDQKSALMKGVDVLIATPGRLLDLFERGGMMLTDARILVIDEADRMLDMGFIPDVEKIVSFLPANRQTLFFSATMAGEIRRLADAFLRNPKEITVTRAASVAPLITEGLAIVAEDDKRQALREIIGAEKVQNALIFCNRKRDVDVLNKSLAKHGFSVGALHGDLAQSVRFATLERFKAGEIRLLVCSDVAARGIDIGGLSHVFNFDVPHHSEDYIHRIGRTGRAGLTGHAYTIAAPADRANLEAIEKLTGHAIPRMAVAGVAAAEWEESDGKRRRGRGKPAAVRAAEPPTAVVAPAASLDAPAADDGAVEVAARRPEGRRRGRGRGGDRTRPTESPQGEAVAEVGNAAAHPEPVARAAEERAPARTRDEAGASGGRRDGVVAAAPAEDRSRGEDRFRRDGDRFRRDGRRRDEDLGPSVLAFGGDVPAFMLLPTRASRLVRLAQAPAGVVATTPARVAAAPSAAAADPTPMARAPASIVPSVVTPAAAVPDAAAPAVTAEPEVAATPTAAHFPSPVETPTLVPDLGASELDASDLDASDLGAPVPEAAIPAVAAQPAPRERAPRRAAPRAPRARKAVAIPTEAAPDVNAVAIRTYRPARDPEVKRAAHSPAVATKRSRRLLGGKVELTGDPAAEADAAPIDATAAIPAPIKKIPASGAVDTRGVPDETAPE